MSCYMAVKPWYRAQTPVGIQPTASTHQLCRRKIQIVSSIQTGGNKPPGLITSSHNFYHLSDNLSLFMQNVCQNILSTMIPNRTVQKLFSVKRLKKKKRKTAAQQSASCHWGEISWFLVCAARGDCLTLSQLERECQSEKMCMVKTCCRRDNCSLHCSPW